MKNSKTKKQSILVAILAFLLVGVLAVGMSSAWFQDKGTSGQATIVIGDKVDISSVTDLATTFTTAKEYLPGDTINSDALNITLLATDDTNPTQAIVRVKLTVDAGSSEKKADLEGMINVGAASTNWFKKGDYYYYNTVVTPLQAGKTIQFPWAAEVPTTWGDAESDLGELNKYANQSVTVKFDVEAVQAKNLVDGHPYFNDVQVSEDLSTVSAKAA